MRSCSANAGSTRWPCFLHRAICVSLQGRQIIGVRLMSARQSLPVVMITWQVSVLVQHHGTSTRWQTACSLLFHCYKQLEGYFPSIEDHIPLWTFTSHPTFTQLPLALLPMENIKYGLVKWRDHLNVVCINQRNVKTAQDWVWGTKLISGHVSTDWAQRSGEKRSDEITC